MSNTGSGSGATKVGVDIGIVAMSSGSTEAICSVDIARYEMARAVPGGMETIPSLCTSQPSHSDRAEEAKQVAHRIPLNVV